MGSCCSCLFPDGENHGDTSKDPSSGAGETEMKAHRAALSISRSMSAPTVQIDLHDPCRVSSGYGLAVVNVPLEQDAAYWEVSLISNTAVNESHQNQLFAPFDIMVGVTTKKSSDFYQPQAKPQQVAPSTNESSDQTGMCRRKR
jgi:hypothetical protein